MQLVATGTKKKKLNKGHTTGNMQRAYQPPSPTFPVMARQ